MKTNEMKGEGRRLLSVSLFFLGLVLTILACNNTVTCFFPHGPTHANNCPPGGSECWYIDLDEECEYCCGVGGNGNDCINNEQYWVTAHDTTGGYCTPVEHGTDIITWTYECLGAIPQGEPYSLECFTTTSEPCGG